MCFFSTYLCSVERKKSHDKLSKVFFERFTFNPLIKRQDETDFESSPDDDDGTLAVVGLPDNKHRRKEDGTCGEAEDGESRLCGTAYR